MNRIYLIMMCLLTVFALGCTEEPAPIAPVEVGSTVPALTSLQYLQGTPATLGTLPSDKAHIIEFWATWCAPCKDSAPVLSALQQQYPDRLRVVGITDELENAVKPYLAVNGESMTYTIALDPDGLVQESYVKGIGEDGIPWAFLIDTQGTLVWVGHPMSPDLKTEVEKLMAPKV